MRYSRHLMATPGQQMPIPGREAEMARNDAGGFGFKHDHWTRLQRFLILGSEGGTFYVGEQKLTVENAAAALQCVREDGLRVVEEIDRVLTSNLAPKVDPSVFVLALCSVHGDEKTRQRIAAVAPRLLRTGTHLLAFISACDSMGKWRRNLRRTVQAWVDARDAEALAYQAIKYQQRDGWSMRDVLRLSHATSGVPAVKAVLDRICGRTVANDTQVPTILLAEKAMRDAVNEGGVEAALAFAEKLPREALPTEVNKLKGYWRTALVSGNLPMTAMIRNLAQMTRVGLLDDRVCRAEILAALRDRTRLDKARVHPLAMLLAAFAYGSGGSAGLSRGAPYTPHDDVVVALTEGFEAGFTKLTRLPGRILAAVDVSGSMTAPVNGSPAMKCRQAAAAIALAVANSAEQPQVVAFNTVCPARSGSVWARTPTGDEYSLDIRPGMRFADAVRKFERMSGGTDCASPIRYARETKQVFDAIVIISDQDSWAGQVHVAQAMASYRAGVAPRAKLIVLGLSGTGTTLVDPKDPLALGIAGFDAGAVEVMDRFLKGAF